MTKLKTTAAAMVAAAKALIREIPAAELVARHGDPDLLIVDIRDIREVERTGSIPGALHAPRGMLEFWIDPDCKYHKPVFADTSKTYVLQCASGWRSALAAATLNDMGFDCAHMTEGFTGWVDADGPVERADLWTGRS